VSAEHHSGHSYARYISANWKTDQRVVGVGQYNIRGRRLVRVDKIHRTVTTVKRYPGLDTHRECRNRFSIWSARRHRRAYCWVRRVNLLLWQRRSELNSRRLPTEQSLAPPWRLVAALSSPRCRLSHLGRCRESRAPADRSSAHRVGRPFGLRGVFQSKVPNASAYRTDRGERGLPRGEGGNWRLDRTALMDKLPAAMSM